MTGGKHDNQTNLVGERNVLGLIVGLVLAQGCTVVPDTSLDVQPDMKAIVGVVKIAYGQLERPASVFLAADTVEETTMARVRTKLSDDLGSTFWPTSARISGDPGASIALRRFHVAEDGRRSVVVNHVQEDGTGRGCTQYSRDRDEDEWVIVRPGVNASPDCPISSQGEESYHDALERARGGACLLFGRHSGTCGSWLYIAEGNGYYGEESYFDLQTGLLVAKHFSDDTGLDEFVFGEDLGCERTVTESIPCGDCLTNVDCDDGIGCTDDTCDAGMCLSRPNDANCANDAKFCNGTERCDRFAGCVSDGEPCAPEFFCNEDTNSCGERLFAMTRRPAFGWCPYENMLLDATVAKGDDGRYIMTGSRTMESAEPLAECTFSESFFVTGCWVSVPMAPMILTDEHAAELERLLANVPPWDCGGDLEFACDPCRVTEFIFDERKETSCCARPRTDYDLSFRQIETLLDATVEEE